MTSETLVEPTLSDDPVISRVDAALQHARREARMDDPGAQRLLDALSTLMATGRGIAELGRVAKQADIPATGARRIFRDRAALLRAYRFRSVAASLGTMRAALAMETGGDRVERTIVTFGTIFAGPIGVSVARSSFATWAQACGDPDLRSNFAETEHMWHDILEQVVAAEIGEGVSPFTPHNVMLILSACVDGVIVASGLTPESSEPERVVATSLALWQLVKARCREGGSR